MIKKYRKKPVVIKAVRVDQHNVHEVLDFIGKDLEAWQENSETGENRYLIQTKEGTMMANQGDWIIRGVENEHYPCRDSVFQATYDEVAE